MTRKVLRNDWLTALRLALLSTKKSLSVAGLVTACSALLCPGLLITEWLDFLRDNTYPYNATDDAFGAMIAAAVFSCGLGLLLTCFNFAYLYKKSPGDLFHSLPLTRSQLLLSRFTACVLPALLPIAVNYTTILLFACDSRMQIDLPMVFGGLALNVAALLCIVAFATVFMVCCGSTFSYIASFAAINVGVPAILFIVDLLCDDLLYGYVSNIEQAYAYCTPLWYAASRYELLSDCSEQQPCGELWGHLLILVVLTAVLLAVTCLLYNRRKSEKAGSAFAFRWTRYPVMGLTCYVGCYLIGSMFESHGTITFFIFASIGAVLIAMAFGAILDKGFKTAKRSVVVGLVSFALLFATFLGVRLDPFGYVDRIPPLSDIESVTYTDMYNSGMTFSDPAAIRQLHETILNNRDVEDDYEDKNDGYYTSSWYSVTITYNLKNGKTVSREYHNRSALVYKQIWDVMTSEAYRQEIDNLLNRSHDGRLYVGYYYEDEDNYEWFELYLTLDQCQEVLDIYYDEATIVGSNFEKTNTLQMGHYGKDYRNGWHFYMPYSSKKFVNTEAYLFNLFAEQYPEKLELFLAE